MKNVKPKNSSSEDHLGCYGNFHLSDPVCTRACALRLRCAVERNRNERLEMMEELVFSEDMSLKIQ